MLVHVGACVCVCANMQTIVFSGAGMEPIVHRWLYKIGGEFQFNVQLVELQLGNRDNECICRRVSVCVSVYVGVHVCECERVRVCLYVCLCECVYVSNCTIWANEDELVNTNERVRKVS